MLFYIYPKFETKILSLTEVIMFARNGLNTHTHTCVCGNNCVDVEHFAQKWGLSSYYVLNIHHIKGFLTLFSKFSNTQN